MVTVQYILMVLLSLPASYLDGELPEERTDRMEVVAQAVHDASARATCTGRFADYVDCKPVWPGTRKDLVLMLITKAWWESRLARNVHEGKCRRHECDATLINGVVIHRARTIWQMQKTGLVQKDEWDTMVGTDFEATRTAAWVAARILSMGKRKCGSPFGTLSFYGRSRCNWSGAYNRVRLFRKLRKKTLEQLTIEAEKRMSAMKKDGAPEEAPQS